MLKGIVLSLTLTIFITSLVFTISSFTGNLQENIITGNVIGISNFTNYNLISLFISFILAVLVVIWMRRS